jgi:hypothetical protein
LNSRENTVVYILEAGKKNTSKFSAWLENYSSFLEALRKEIDNFERDEARVCILQEDIYLSLSFRREFGSRYPGRWLAE